MNANNKNKVWTSANIVSLVRILLVPVFVVAILGPWPEWMNFWPDANLYKPWVAAFVFLILSLTDTLDGHLARSKNQVTDLGKFLDPLADKILVLAALLALVELHCLPSWPVIIIITREFVVSGLRMYAASRNLVIAASYWGKSKTVFQILAILLFIVKGSALIPAEFYWPMYIISWSIMIIALILTIISMIDYMHKCKDLFKG
ncbi:MAG: CDP-diacylglycerol--glycerol-3-phosphate 3-phosphatidyltransferase [Enterococcus sp.]|nr:CDP-diacylglycerol--glycerol-3-phosphate 3-phosphatidyltransferase [Enterococcus sp.]